MFRAAVPLALAVEVRHAAASPKQWLLISQQMIEVAAPQAALLPMLCQTTLDDWDLRGFLDLPMLASHAPPPCSLSNPSLSPVSTRTPSLTLSHSKTPRLKP